MIGRPDSVLPVGAIVSYDITRARCKASVMLSSSSGASCTHGYISMMLSQSRRDSSIISMKVLALGLTPLTTLMTWLMQPCKISSAEILLTDSQKLLSSISRSVFQRMAFHRTRISFLTRTPLVASPINCQTDTVSSF